MPLTDDELRLIDEYLDGEADPAAAEAVRRLVSTRDEAAAALDAARAARAGRATTYAAAERDEDDAAVDRLLATIRDEQVREREHSHARGPSVLRTWLPRVAAVLVVGLVGVSSGYLLGWQDPAVPMVSSPTPRGDGGYVVHVMDQGGDVVRSVPFATLPEAQAGRERLREEARRARPAAAE